MSMEQRHVVKRQIIELTVQNRATAPAIQDKVSSIYRQRIVSLIDRYCTELGQPDRLYRIDSLELDLGILDMDDLEEEFVAKASNALRQALSAQIARQEEDTHGFGRSPKSQSALELFTFFLETGSLPWWADDAQPTLLAETLQQLLDEAPDELRRLLQGSVLEEASRRRLIGHYNDEQLMQMAGLFLPGWKSSFKEDIKALKSLLQKTKIAAASGPTFLRQRIWANVLQVVSFGGQQYDSPQAFYLAVLKRFAADLRTPYAKLASEIQEAAPVGRRTGGSRHFKTFLQSLADLTVGTPIVSADELVRSLERLRAVSLVPLTEAWNALLASSKQFTPQARATWASALSASRSEIAAENAVRLLNAGVAHHGLPPAEHSKLAKLFRTALEALDRQPTLGRDLDELNDHLRRYQSEGGPLAEAWAALLVLSGQLEPQALAAWLDALAASGSGIAAENAVRLLEAGAAQHGLSAAERSKLVELFRRQTESEAMTNAEDSILQETGDQLAALLRRYQSEGGLLAEAWAMLRALSLRLPPQAQAAWLDALSASRAENAAETAIRLLNAGAAQHGLRANERTSLLQLLRAAIGPQPVVALPRPDMRFSEADEIAVANAGLVILWPFISSFFTHLGLVEERQFKDLPARQRGVGLLQVLAAQKVSPPEYLLPLNKLLCGMEPNHVFDFGPPLRKPEKRECEKLLKAVISQVPILRSMSVEGFRGSFLLRRGQLSIRDGLWLLRVERQTYDVVLERFPWSWQWVKLPWMETPLQVEWQFT